MSYEQHNHIVLPYGQVHHKQLPASKEETLEKLRIIHSTKRKLAAWFVSKCISYSGREKLVKEMEKRAQIDIYGRCGTKLCGLHTSFKEHEECDLMLEKEYFFYLALENSKCPDYITEKFWRALNFYAIPIVLENYNYIGVAPPNSYIAIDSFPSIDALIAHMKAVAGNATLWESYHMWRTHFDVRTGGSPNLIESGSGCPGDLFTEALCELCEKLHAQQDKGRQMPSVDLEKWASNTRDSCVPSVIEW